MKQHPISHMSQSLEGLNLLDSRITKAIERKPNASDASIAKNIKTNVMEVRRVRGYPNAGTSPSAGVLIAGQRVLSRRPPESAAKFIKRLPDGRGFEPRELSKQWGMSEETIKRHARDINCLKFVELSADEWTQLIMNPETSKKYEA